MAKKYVLCDTNCKWEALDKEETLSAIQQALENGSVQEVDPEAPFITKIKEQNGGKAFSFWLGTQAEYNALTETEENCLYIITDDGFIEGVNSAIDSLREDLNQLTDNTRNLSEQLVNGGITVKFAETAHTASEATIARLADNANNAYNADALKLKNYHPNHDVTETGLYAVTLTYEGVAAVFGSVMLSITELGCTVRSASVVVGDIEGYCEYSSGTGKIVAKSNGTAAVAIKAIYKIATYYIND